MKSRFTDAFTKLADFSENFLIQCPKCQKAAEVKSAPAQDVIRASCLACGFNKDWTDLHPGIQLYATNSRRFKTGLIGIGASTDWYFHYSLWLTTHCGGHELWAFNAKHLAWLKTYVSADLRERTSDCGIWCNGSLASRLPNWLKSTKNCDEVLKAIARLEKLIPETKG